MTTKATFYPLGNADCCLLDVECGTSKKKMLFDYANTRNPEDPNDLRIDLPTVLRDDLKSAGRGLQYDIVAFTHLDDDHVCGMSQFFHLEHAAEHQGSDRVKILELWVPAAAITEAKEQINSEDGLILQAEARHRLKKGTGIRVFSRPATLDQWLRDQGIDPATRAHLITDAGQTIPGFTKEAQGAEFFVHSPFAVRSDGEVKDRNNCSLIVQATFSVGGHETRLILSADSDSDVLTDLVRVTESHGNDERLEWEVFKLPHHCSYKSLNKDERGTEKTQPVPDVARLFEDYGAEGGIVVSPSKPIPHNDDDDQPPHRQAAKYYVDLMNDKGGEFKVTMQHPTSERPEPLVILIDESGARVEKKDARGSAPIVGRMGSRMG